MHARDPPPKKLPDPELQPGIEHQESKARLGPRSSQATAGYPRGSQRVKEMVGLPGKKVMPPKNLKPGEITPESGQYKIVGPPGGDRGREVTGVKGKPLPPTQQSGDRYQLVDKTKHKGRP
jgi:hypothetical protein